MKRALRFLCRSALARDMVWLRLPAAGFDHLRQDAAATLNRPQAGSYLRIPGLLVIVSLFVAIPASAQEMPAPIAPIEMPSIDAASSASTAAGSTAAAASASSDPLKLSINLEGSEQKGQLSVAVQIVVLMTLLSVAPSLVLLMTSFTRIVIVLGFVRTALGVQSAPSNQIIIGLSLFLTFFIMSPVIDRVHGDSLKPYMAGEITSEVAMERATGPVRDFMLKQTRTRDLEYFLELGGYGPTAVKDLPMRVVVPAFVISELQTAFQMGFLLFLPFLVIDFLVSSVLMSLGMMMMPPNVVSLPIKLLLFVLVDGWHLIVKSLVQSFSG
ncbi:MAG TPA: flagellar type III secretion system pore protein FliP [Opitutaceae bacterium]|nr:flagellar type III secretion system pore protein FliP [Opitutaceae bacterium]